MRTFEKPNLSNEWKCPICNTHDEKEVVLVGILGTEDGNNQEAEQIHLDCISLTWDKGYEILFQRIRGAE